MKTAAAQTKDGGPSTRQRIIATAVRRFAIASCDDAHLRDIAADVGVDVAYVHRSFGSKEKLFLEVLDEISPHQGLADIPLEDLARHLVGLVFDDSMQRPEGEPDPLQILVRSLAIPAAAGHVGARLHQIYVEPLRMRLGDETALRAATIMSTLIGLRIMRKLLKLPAVTDAGVEEAMRTVLPVVTGLMAGRDGEAP